MERQTGSLADSIQTDRRVKPRLLQESFFLPGSRLYNTFRGWLRTGKVKWNAAPPIARFSAQTCPL